MAPLSLVLALSALVFTGFPDPTPAAASPFSGCPTRTGASATVLIPSLPSLASPSGPLEVGDVLAVYAGGTCVGTAAWAGSGLALTVWADDPYTEARDGFTAGEPLQIQVWDASANAAHESGLTVSFEDGFGIDGGLGADHVYVVAPAPAGQGAEVWISEVDANARPGEGYVEIQSATPGAALPALTLVAVDAERRVYGSVDLGGVQTTAGGLAVVRPEGTTADAAVRMAVQAAETAGAFTASAGAFALYPTALAPAVGQTVAASVPLDAVVSAAPGDARAEELLAAVGQSVQFVDAPEASIGRLAGASARASLFHAAAPNPGQGNPATVQVEGHGPDARADGYRLVSAPILSEKGEAMVVGDLEIMNPVRGIPGSADPDAAPNVWTGFDAADGLVSAVSASAPLAPGVGFMWHWAAPSSARATDAGASFQLARSGRALDDAHTAGPYARSVAAPAAHGLYMVGNPYVYPFRLSGLAVEGGTLQTALAAWDPVEGTYVDLFTRPDAPDHADVLPVWGGAIAEVTAVEGDAFSLVSTSAQVDPTAQPGPGAATAPRLSFTLTGTLADGTSVVDRSAHVRQIGGGTDGWDLHDASKLTPPRAAFALVAPVGTRGGAPRRQRVLSLPEGQAPTVPLAFTATAAGTFTLRWSATLETAGLELVDLELDERVSLASASEYTFTTGGPSAWSDRFEIRASGATASGDRPDAAAVTVGAPYPNPVTTAATLSVHCAAPQQVRAEVYDAVGRRVAEVPEQTVSGQTQIQVDARGLAPGVYIVRVSGETFAETRRVTVAR